MSCAGFKISLIGTYGSVFREFMIVWCLNKWDKKGENKREMILLFSGKVGESAEKGG